MTRRPVVCAALLVLPFSLFGQDSTAKANATPFHQGQWAAQFQAGAGFGSLGFIKFRSPTCALVLDLRLGGAHSEELTTDSSGANRFAHLNSNAFTQVRFGWRQYSGDGTAAKVVSHYSFGALAGFNHFASRDPTGSSQTNGWMAGAFADVGGTYLLTSRFGIGALATASLSYQNSLGKSSLSGRYRDWSIGGSAASASLVATLYF